MATKPPKPKADQPESVTLASPYAYYDDEGVLHRWSAGHVVTEAAEVVDLIARQAPLKD